MAAMSATKNRVLLIGPSRLALSGVSTHINQLMGSELGQQFDLRHFQVGSEGRNEGSIGKILRILMSPIGLALHILAQRPDIVHFNTSLVPKSFWRDAVYLMVAKALRRRVVYQIHGGKLPGDFFQGAAFRRFLRGVLRLPDVIVVLAQIERRAYSDFCAAGQIEVIPNAVDLAQFRPKDARNDPRLLSDPLRLAYMGRLADGKGMSEAIEALALLERKHGHGFELVIAGSGPAEAALRARARELRLEQRVCFCGSLFGEKKAEFWHDADIFVFPTLTEGLPYTVLESLASGTPIVTTSVGAIPEYPFTPPWLLSGRRERNIRYSRT